MSASLRELDVREYGDWPLSYRVMACTLLALLAFALPWFALTRAILAERQALAVVERELQTRLLQARQQVDALPSLPPDMAEPEAAPVPDIPALITGIAETAQAAGLHGGQFRPISPPATGASADAALIELRLHGGWPQLVRFAAALAVPGRDAVLGLHDLRLRAQASPGAMLELSATVWIHPHSGTGVIPLPTPAANASAPRNPFTGMTTRASVNPDAVVGSLRNGRGHARLVLTADGQLRRVGTD